MKTRSRGRFVLIVCVATLLLVLALFALLHTPSVKTYIQAKAADYLLTGAGIDFEAERIDYSLFLTHVEWRRCSLGSANNPDLPPFLTAQQVSFRLSLAALIRGDLPFLDVNLDNPVVRIFVAADGRDNLPVLPAGESPPANPVTFRIPSMRMSDGALHYDDLPINLAVDLPRWNLNAGQVSDPGGIANVRFETVQEGRLTLNQEEMLISRMLLEGELDSSQAVIRNLFIDSGTARVTARGEISLADSRMNLRIEAAAMLDQLESFLKSSHGFQGKVNASCIVTGTPSTPEIEGDITGDALSAFGYTDLEVAAHPHWSGGTGVLEIDAFTMRSGTGSVAGSARLVTAGSQASRVRAKLVDWDVRPVSALLDLPVQVASRAGMILEAEWPGTDFAGAGGSAAIRLAPEGSRVRGNLVPLSASLQLTHNEGRTQLDISSADIPGLRLHGEVSLLNYETLAGTVDLELLDLGEVSEGARSLFESGSPADPLPLSGSADIAARIGGTLKRPEFELELAGRQIQAGSIHDIALGASLHADTSRIRLLNARIDWGAITVLAGGSLSLEQSPPTLAFSARIDPASLDGIRAALGSEIPVAGTIEARAEIAGALSNPDADAEVRVRMLQVYGEALGDLRSEIRLSGKRLELTKLSIEATEDPGVSRETFAANGYYDLDSGSYELQSKARSMRLRGVAPAGGLPVRGILDFTAAGSGSLSDPDLTATLDLRDCHVGETSLGRLQADAHLQGRLADVSIQAPELNLTASGNVKLQPPYPAQISAAAQGTTFDRFNLTIAPETPLRGSVSGRISASGNFEEWRLAEGNAEIQELQLALREDVIRNEGSVQLSLADGILKIEHLVLSTDDSSIRIDGSVPLLDPEAPGSLRLAGRVDLADMTNFLAAEEGISWAGLADLNVMVEGSREAARASGSAGLRGGSFQSAALPVPITQLEAGLRIQDGMLLLDPSQGRLADGSIRLQGQLPLGMLVGDSLPLRLEAAGGAARLVADIVDLPAASLPQVPARVTGTIGLHVDAEAAEPQLDAVKAEVRFEKLDLVFDQYRITQPAPAVIAIDGGIARIRQFAVSGPGTELTAAGTAALTGDNDIDLQIRGRVNAGLLTFFSRDLSGGGIIDVQLDVGNNLGAPQLTGYLESQDALLAIRNPRLQVSDLNFRIALEGERLSIDRLTAQLNGGSLRGTGGLKIAGTGIAEVDIRADARDVSLDFPAGLRSALDADLTIRSQDDLIVLGGSAVILEGAYRESLDLQGEVLRYLRSDQSLSLSAEPNPLLSKIRYRVLVETRNQVLVDNNLAKLALDANLEVTGTYYRPVVTGRITMDEGGEVYLRERTYIIDRGIIDLQNPLRIEPEIDLLAKTRVGAYDIDLQVNGTPENLTSSLTSPSDPDLTEPDIVSLLLTGRTLENIQGAQLNVAKEQALSLLAGYAAESISRGVQQTIGLSQVRLEPNLISPESEPGARLTIGQNISPKLQLIYSMNLANSQDQIWIADFQPIARFDTRAIRQSDSSFRFDFRHDLRFGGTGIPASSARTRAELKVGQIEFRGNLLFPESDLKRKLAFSTGDRYDFFKVRKGADRLEEFYSSRDYLEAQLRLNRREKEPEVDFAVDIDPGPRVTFEFDGVSPSGDLRTRVRQAWKNGVFDQQRSSEAIRIIRESLVKDGYLQPEILNDVEEFPERAEKHIVFRVKPGVQYRESVLILEGASALTPSRLKAMIDSAGRSLDAYLAPETVVDFLSRVYRNEGYLDARVDPPEIELDPDARRGTVTIHIDEGPLFHFGSSEFKGNVTYAGTELAAAISPFTGRPYKVESLSDVISRLQDFYWHRGFNDVVINYTLERGKDLPLLDLEFQIIENNREVVERVTVLGAERSGAEFVRSRLAFSAGEPLDFAALNRSRKRLYDTGAYTMVDLKTVEAKNAGAVPAAAGTRPVEVRVNLREVKPYRFNYGGFYDTDRGPGGIAEFTRQNLLGAGRQLGAQGRYDGDLHEVRGFFGQPMLRNFPLKTSATVFLRREINPTFLTDRIGFSLQQEGQFRGHFVLSYGYRYDRTHTFDKVPDPIFPFDITLPVARLSLSLTRDVRDDLLDASRGSFSSHTFEYAPELLGSEVRFLRYFGQYFHYLPLARASEVPLSGGMMKSRLVYAGAVRLGIAKGLGGQIVVRSERFFAGGGTTVRGFEARGMGPVDFEGNPVGGDVMFVINNEIRFPILSIFDGVGFLDLGNIYATTSDFDPFQVRKSAGFGVRVRTPFLLLRLDYGFKLDRMFGERLGKLYFSIGQAF